MDKTVKFSYAIKKKMERKGVKTHVLLVNSLGEVLEFSNEEEVKDLASILNSNTDSGWRYEIIEIKLR
tara:strand:- start:4014 stop:4217 length:204 start_codon:yes stop_codon:yes gene_type:complete